MTDYSTWDRQTLEALARDLADDNLALRADLRTAMVGWRWAALSAPAPIMRPEFVEGLLREGSGPALAVLPGDLDQLDGGVAEGVSARR